MLSLTVSASLALALPLPLPQDALELRHASMDVMLAHPKDAGLRAVLDLLPSWIEAMAEREGEALPPGIASLAMELLTADTRLAVGPRAAAAGEMPIRALLELRGASEAAVTAQMEFMEELLELAGLPLEQVGPSGLRPLELGLGTPLGMGARGDRLVLALGDDGVGSAASGSDLPDGVTPHMSMRLDAAAVAELIVAFADDEDLVLGAAEMQLLGLRDTRIEVGSDGERGWSASRAADYGRQLTEAGVLAETGITTDVLRRFPADCTLAAAWRMEWGPLLRFTLEPIMASLASQGLPPSDPFEEFTAATGMDLEEDLLAAFGPTAGMFLSETTGGGRLTSAVLMIEVRDEPLLRSLMDDLAEVLTALGDDEAAPRMQAFERAGTAYTSLVVPGLPVPVEPTWALDDGVLYLGLSPQAALAAIDSARAGGAGLADNPRFVEAAQTLGADDRSVSMVFVDTPALLADGYPWMNLGMAAVANALRSAPDSEELALLLPTLPALRSGARASLELSRVDGDDLVSLGTMDPSWTVNATGLMGALDQSGLLMLLPLIVASQTSGSSSIEYPLLEDDWETDDWDLDDEEFEWEVIEVEDVTDGEPDSGGDEGESDL